MSSAGSILVATDFSPHARHAADRGARLAQECGGTLALLHVLAGPGFAHLPEWLRDASALEARLMEQAREQLEAIATRLRSSRHVGTETVVRDGSVLPAVLEQAEANDARLIVVGARGAGFMRRLTIGTTAERLVRSTARPVLVVRQTPHERYRRIMVAVDFSEWSLGALEAARWIAPHAQLVLTNVFSVPYQDKLRLAGVSEATLSSYRERARAEATQQLHALAASGGLAAGHWQPCVVEGDAPFKLLELEQEMDCDLIVVGKHGIPLAVELLLGSVTRLLIAEASADVLVSTKRGG
jgi:nucleotide-binding universal stress UspA family protein